MNSSQKLSPTKNKQQARQATTEHACKHFLRTKVARNGTLRRAHIINLCMRVDADRRSPSHFWVLGAVAAERRPAPFLLSAFTVLVGDEYLSASSRQLTAFTVSDGDGYLSAPSRRVICHEQGRKDSHFCEL